MARDTKGRFLPGPDKDRHVFTRDECTTGFWHMIESITVRYPDAYNTMTGQHMVLRALPALIKKRAA